MYKGHVDISNFTIYSLSRDVIDAASIDVNLLVDFGARHGESIAQLAKKCQPGADYVLVEPVPKCVAIIKSVIHDSTEQLKYTVIDAIVGDIPGDIDIHTFESDNDQSANVFSDRKGVYGRAKKVKVRVVGYDVFDTLYNDREIDFAKVNIEGSEYSMIESGFFKKKVKSFVMELHNRHVPDRTWFNAVEGLKNDFDIKTYGDLSYKYCFMSGIKCV